MAESTGFNGDAVLSYELKDKSGNVVSASDSSTPVSGVRVKTAKISRWKSEVIWRSQIGSGSHTSQCGPDFYLRFSIAFDDDRTLKSCPEIALKIAPGKKLSEESSTFL